LPPKKIYIHFLPWFLQMTDMMKGELSKKLKRLLFLWGQTKCFLGVNVKRISTGANDKFPSQNVVFSPVIIYNIKINYLSILFKLFSIYTGGDNRT